MKPLAERDYFSDHSILTDPYAYLYDVAIQYHLVRLKTAATQPFGYKVFYAAKKGVDWKPPDTYREKMRHYIRAQHPSWRPTRGGDASSPVKHPSRRIFRLARVRRSLGSSIAPARTCRRIWRIRSTGRRSR